ncbi:MAG: tRNA threonylcarbamoyladenosine dehydratase [Bacteroidaceae bacterium]|nr:tRNA threonylcarbamoyladenosine dehydratase [Bacteroidaceae bacterium]
MVMDNEIFNRSELLLGAKNMQRLASVKVLVVGVGGVGSWCAESLIRTGIRHLTIIDADVVQPSNINRQLMATSLTVGQVKVDALRERLLQINPDADIQAIRMVYNEETAHEIDLNNFDYVVDAIDSLKDKALLILNATASKAKLFASMGAALKLDPTKIEVAEFWKVKGDPLAKALRNRFKKSGEFPKRKFKCVFSEERLPFKTEGKGSLSQITAIFGFTLAGLVVNEIMKNEDNE